jgi:hypothetical protein
MVIKSQSLNNSRLLHHHKRETVNQSPGFVLILFVEGEGSIEEFWCRMDNLHFTRGEEPFNNLNRFLFEAPGQGVPDFEQHGVGDKQRMVFLEIGQFGGALVILIAAVDKSDYE